MRKIIVFCLLFIVIVSSISATGKVSTELKLTLLERRDLNDVKYISMRKIQHDDSSFILFFKLTDSSGNALKPPVYVDIRIENSYGTVVYEKTRTVLSSDYAIWTSSINGEQLLASVFIPDSEIKPSISESGTLFYKVYYPGYIEFDEYELDINGFVGKLPFKADYSNPTKVNPYDFDENCENPLMAKKLYSGIPISIRGKVSYIHYNSYNDTYSVTLSDHSSGTGNYRSYYIDIEVDDVALDKLADVKIGQSVTFCGYVDFDSYSPTLTHAIIL